jgi:hypothetical protein
MIPRKKICYAVGYHKFVALDLDGTSRPRIVLLCPTPPTPPPQTSTRATMLLIPIVKKEDK